ncbi:type II secretion system protein [uncultured Clostridium sp.]|uniref:type II secretion system protein n=1 Tax=uncultured Clostridium sp. TaxID=59620 RepID=UPI0025E9F773|nr:type II secretion system protein [uncultured Clostridium sp.]
MRIGLRKEKCKKGFTLIELIVVMCIIGILAGTLIPQISGYITEAKKLKVLDQSRSVVMAVESYNLKSTSKISKSDTIISIKSRSEVSKYLKDVNLTNLNEGTTVGECYSIVNGSEFEIDESTEKLTNVISPVQNQTVTQH